jgi:two-component system OmpR family response regulator
MRVLVVDDDPSVLRLLRKALRKQTYAVDVAVTGEEALSKALSFDYDVILLDITIPAPNGLEVCRQLRANERWTPILLVSGESETKSLVEGLDAGADDYLTKPFALGELSARVRALVRRQSEERPSILKIGDVCLDPATRDVTVDGVAIDLTPREFAMLELFLRNPDRVLDRAYLLKHVWDFSFDTGSNVVDVYVRYLRKKLDAASRTSHIESIRGVGYRFVGVDRESRSDPGDLD